MIIFIAVIGVLVLAGIIAFQVMNAGLSDLTTAEITDVDLTAVADGVYEGKYTQLPVSATVHVTVANHEITAIEIVQHFNGQGQDGEAVIDAVLASGTIEVDTIAGATYSSIVILLAIQDALSTLKLVS